MSACTNAEFEGAVETLLRGYEEEKNLYLAVRGLTLSQRVALRRQHNLARANDLADQAQDLLQMIDQIEENMVPARELVMTRDPEDCPHGLKLNQLLDRLAQIIEDIRTLETANAGEADKLMAQTAGCGR